MLIVEVFNLNNQQYVLNVNIKYQLQKSVLNLSRGFGTEIYNLKFKSYNLAGSTHLKMCDSCGITNLSEILAIRAGNFIK